MKNSDASTINQISWSSLRKRADQLGIPAWRLAEDLYSHHEKDTVFLAEITNGK